MTVAERVREIFQLLVHILIAHDAWDWARAKPGAPDGSASTEASAAFPGALARIWIWIRAARARTGAQRC